MRAVTLEQYESPLAGRGVKPSGLSEEAAKLDSEEVWLRIEAYTAYRFWPRECIWTVEGPGDWPVPLYPATIAKVESWLDDAWTETTAYGPSPHGLSLPAGTLYRITGEVGDWDGTPGIAADPIAFDEAYRRLAEYLATGGCPGWEDCSYGRIGGGGVSLIPPRRDNWLGRAMQLSGAADMLRGYRRSPGC